jgi:hypothetical protein
MRFLVYYGIRSRSKIARPTINIRQNKGKLMVPIKTAKALSLSLLLSFTASITAWQDVTLFGTPRTGQMAAVAAIMTASPKGWTEWFKNKLTPTNIAIASALAAAGSYAAYHYWAKRRPTTY